MKTCSSEGNGSIVRIAMPGALQMFPGWFSSLAWKNLRDCLAAAGGWSAMGTHLQFSRGSRHSRKCGVLTTVHYNCAQRQVQLQKHQHKTNAFAPPKWAPFSGRNVSKIYVKNCKTVRKETCFWNCSLGPTSEEPFICLWIQKRFSTHLRSSVSPFNSSLIMIIY